MKTISNLWDWIIIGLIVSGAGSGIVLLGIFIYLLVFYRFFADKLTSTLTFAKNLASYPLKRLRA